MPYNGCEDSDSSADPSRATLAALAAERVVRELSDRVGELKLAAPEPRAGPSDGMAQVLDDAVSALVNLGYQRAEAKSAVDSLASAAAEGVETIIRRSLVVLVGEK